MMQQASEPARERAARVDLSRTWELELFISGATVFALLQAPALVDRWWLRTDPHLTGTIGFIAFFAYYYSKLILYTLICAFVLHLLARAYWVSLVGVHSVFPGGVRWENLRYGPAFTRTVRSRLPGMQTSIERIDNLSSLLFAGGILTMMTFVLSVLMAAALAIPAVGLSLLLFDGRHAGRIVMVGLLLVAMVPVMARALDHRYSERPPTDARARLLDGITGAAYSVNGSWLLGPIAFVLGTNLRRRTTRLATGLVFLGLVGTFIVRDVLLRNGAVLLDSHVYEPVAVASLRSDPDHYAASRGDDEVHEVKPYIQAEIITEPYVRLFIPVVPSRLNELIGERCRDVPRATGRGVRMAIGQRGGDSVADVAALISCLSALQPVTLDGRALQDLPFRLTSDARSGVRGIAAHIPVEGLPAGEHVLRVEGLPRPQTSNRPPRAPHIIRFWR